MKIIFSLFFTLCCSLFSATSLNAQDVDTRTFAIVDYMKVAPGMRSEYLACENAWKSLHQARVKAGEIEAWELEEVVYSGVTDEYNYMTITIVKGWAAVERGNMDFEKLITSVPADQRKYIENANDYRTWVKNEIWVVQDRVFTDSESRALYRVENFSDLPAGGNSWKNYMSMEKDFAKPVIEERVKTGKQAGWVLTSLFRSRGSAYPYHVSTVDFFNSWEDITARDNESWKTVYPSLTNAQINEMIYTAKKPVRSEIRKLVLYTD